MGLLSTAEEQPWTWGSSQGCNTSPAASALHGSSPPSLRSAGQGQRGSHALQPPCSCLPPPLWLSQAASPEPGRSSPLPARERILATERPREGPSLAALCAWQGPAELGSWRVGAHRWPQHQHRQGLCTLGPFPPRWVPGYEDTPNALGKVLRPSSQVPPPGPVLLTLLCTMGTEAESPSLWRGEGRGEEPCRAALPTSPGVSSAHERSSPFPPLRGSLLPALHGPGRGSPSRSCQGGNQCCRGTSPARRQLRHPALPWSSGESAPG